MNKIILASKSPRRADILKQMGLEFSILASDFDESSIPEDGSPENYCKQLAESKAEDIARKYPNSVIIAADTIVVLEQHILGKPDSEDEAIQMLESLSGKWHRVMTAFSIVHKTKNYKHTALESTEVKFRKLGKSEMSGYVEDCQPMDKAGAYGIQDISYSLVEKINGCYFNVMGFPATHFYTVWKDFKNQFDLDEND